MTGEISLLQYLVAAEKTSLRPCRLGSTLLKAESRQERKLKACLAVILEGVKGEGQKKEEGPEGFRQKLATWGVRQNSHRLRPATGEDSSTKKKKPKLDTRCGGEERRGGGKTAMPKKGLIGGDFLFHPGGPPPRKNKREKTRQSGEGKER